MPCIYAYYRLKPRIRIAKSDTYIVLGTKTIKWQNLLSSAQRLLQSENN